MKSGGYTYHRLQMMDNSNRSILRNNDQEESSSKRLEMDNIRHLINHTCKFKVDARTSVIGISKHHRTKSDPIYDFEKTNVIFYT
jgi:hypothetical protein